ncbi:unnamed protein product [Schistosoma mattheei]|uniref:Uncharacterized protein n=1 Tax=Schistosoma mattheei TaxID=31246 RepID=A0A3P8GRK6_9TREM|nr:unnamed protein product [Schistosoma mattheei]
MDIGLFCSSLPSEHCFREPIEVRKQRRIFFSLGV